MKTPNSIVRLYAYSEGSEAAKLGALIVNPYPSDTISHAAWAYGFNDAKGLNQLHACAGEMLAMLIKLDAWLAFRPDVASEIGRERVKALIAKAGGSNA